MPELGWPIQDRDRDNQGFYGNPRSKLGGAKGTDYTAYWLNLKTSVVVFSLFLPNAVIFKG